MLSSIHLTNLWVFYVLVYVIAFPLRQRANTTRGECIEDPEMLMQHKLLLVVMLLGCSVDWRSACSSRCVPGLCSISVWRFTSLV